MRISYVLVVATCSLCFEKVNILHILLRPASFDACLEKKGGSPHCRLSVSLTIAHNPLTLTHARSHTQLIHCTRTAVFMWCRTRGNSLFLPPVNARTHTFFQGRQRDKDRMTDWSSGASSAFSTFASPPSFFCCSNYGPSFGCCAHFHCSTTENCDDW